MVLLFMKNEKKTTILQYLNNKYYSIAYKIDKRFIHAWINTKSNISSH